jgi:hypothetical protein
VLEAPGLVAGFDDLAVVGEAVEQGGRHFGIAEDGGPFAEGEYYFYLEQKAEACDADDDHDAVEDD